MRTCAHHACHIAVFWVANSIVHRYKVGCHRLFHVCLLLLATTHREEA